MTQTTQKIRDYTVLSTLGQNREGGRITHLAQAPDGSKVVIKEFQFLSGSKWDDYSAIAREIEILKNLDHPRIPKFLESFETDEGACLVQQYIEAPNLDQKRTFSIDQVEKIAKDLLEILCYLQSLSPPVLHRDIKPGNLLLDSENNLYLVDFGFSRIGLEDIAVSSMVRGTTGFMPPEQMLGLDLTKASDLYSVGATLVCLILGIPSGRMAGLVDIGENRLKFGDRLPSDIDPHFVRWLKRMTEPRAGDRFADAAEALDGLEPSKRQVDWDEMRFAGIRAYPQTNGLLVKKVVNGEAICFLSGRYGFQKKKVGFAFRDKFYYELEPGKDVFAEPIPLLKFHFHESSRHGVSVNIENAAKNLLVAKAASIDSFEQGQYGFVLQPWHLYAGYFAAVVTATAGLYFFSFPMKENLINAVFQTEQSSPQQIK